MLNKVIEKNAVKCHPYWPMGEDEIHEYGDYRVRNQSERAETAYVVRDLILEHIPVSSFFVLIMKFTNCCLFATIRQLPVHSFALWGIY